MRKQLILFLILCFVIGFTLSLSAEGFADAYAKGNGLYEEGRYPEALDAYLAVEKEGAHWMLFYNIGNCYYKLNDFVKAKIYYLRARRLKPFEPSISKNIDIVDKRFSDKIEARKPDFLSRVALRIETFISINVVSVALLLSVIILNVFIFILIRKGKSRALVYGVSFSLVIMLLIAGYHIYRTGKQNLRNSAVIVKAGTELRSGPGENNTILFKVNPGLTVKIIEKSRNWLQVSASMQVAGWLQEDRLERI
jgi:tetratricopeptide (TPR) repeat protein